MADIMVVVAALVPVDFMDQAPNSLRLTRILLVGDTDKDDDVVVADEDVLKHGVVVMTFPLSPPSGGTVMARYAIKIVTGDATIGLDWIGLY